MLLSPWELPAASQFSLAARMIARNGLMVVESLRSHLRVPPTSLLCYPANSERHMCTVGTVHNALLYIDIADHHTEQKGG